MSDIQDEAYSEAMDEIEQLKAQLREYRQQGIGDLLRLIDEEKVLLTRAADALQEEFGSPNDPAYGIKGPVHELITELRKAAE
jgi:hypothetical protein